MDIQTTPAPTPVDVSPPVQPVSSRAERFFPVAGWFAFIVGGIALIDITNSASPFGSPVSSRDYTIYVPYAAFYCLMPIALLAILIWKRSISSSKIAGHFVVASILFGFISVMLIMFGAFGDSPAVYRGLDVFFYSAAVLYVIIIAGMCWRAMLNRRGAY